jgi:hypothetical protein
MLRLGSNPNFEDMKALQNGALSHTEDTIKKQATSVFQSTFPHVKLIHTNKRHHQLVTCFPSPHKRKENGAKKQHASKHITYRINEMQELLRRLR